MNQYQTMLDSIVLRYGVPQSQVYGGATMPTIQAQQSNAYAYRKLKNQIVYGNALENLLENRGTVDRGGWQ